MINDPFFQTASATKSQLEDGLARAVDEVLGKSDLGMAIGQLTGLGQGWTVEEHVALGRGKTVVKFLAEQAAAAQKPVQEPGERRREMGTFTPYNNIVIEGLTALQGDVLNPVLMVLDHADQEKFGKDPGWSAIV